MPNKCCVPGCRGNYDKKNKVAVFSFPKNEEAQKAWLGAIPRKDYVITKNSKVCELHFNADDMMKKNPIKFPRLRKHAVPSKFPNCPSYLSKSIKSRSNPEERRAKLEDEALQKGIEASLLSKAAYDSNTSFSSLAELTSCLKKASVPDAWTVIYKETCTMFLLLCVEPIPSLDAAVVVEENLTVTASVSKIQLHCRGKKYKLPRIVNNIKDLFEILELVQISKRKNTEFNDPETVSVIISTVVEMLKGLCYFLQDHRNKINFLMEQVNFLNVNKHCVRYSADTLILCTLLHSISPHSYRFLRSSGNLVLPHPNTLKNLCSMYNTNPRHEQQEDKFLHYMKNRFLTLKPHECYVTLMMDEIHLKPYFDFKGGNILGMACDSTNAASSAHVFMVQSLLSDYKDVVHILPVNKINAENLHSFLKKIILGLENVGFKVICVVSDNNSINRKCMSLFASPPEFSIVYPHPSDSSRPLFFVIDSVHLLKCIRNNWLNQKNAGQCIFFPSFECSIMQNNKFEIETASFSTLKSLHQLESGSLLKFGYGLTLKALYPSSLERQNVKLALQIFNRHLSTGLLEVGEEKNLLNYKGTSSFINIICNWWDIVNVKSPFKGKRLRNSYQQPLVIDPNDDENIKFLEQFHDWLYLWKKQNFCTGNLTRDTHSALAHTTHALIELTRFCISELNFKYFLPGKIQTDALEDRFGKYRQLSGSQYCISICQLYEAENKLRLAKYLPLMLESTTFGKISINDFENTHEEMPADFNDTDVVSFLDIISVDRSDIDAVQSTLPIITYLSGYSCHQLLKKLKCLSCENNLILDKKLDLDTSYKYIRSMDRGGLLCPNLSIISAVTYNYIVVQQLISKHEDKFLKLHDQRRLVTTLTLELLKMEEDFLEDFACSEGHSAYEIVKCILWSSTNTLLKNYCKKKNDTVHILNHEMKQSAKKRKLQTLQKQNLLGLSSSGK